jgi:hypothetical protein
MFAIVSVSCESKLPATTSMRSFALSLRMRNAGAALDRQGRLERLSFEVDLVRRKLGDPVRDDRAEEVDRFSSRSPQRYRTRLATGDT